MSQSADNCGAPGASPMISEYRLHRRLHFYETDAAGIVHFTSFFRYMEEAEHALWREAGVSTRAAMSEVSWPRLAASCDFRHPLRFDQEFEIWVRIAEIGSQSIRYSFVMSDG